MANQSYVVYHRSVALYTFMFDETKKKKRIKNGQLSLHLNKCMCHQYSCLCVSNEEVVTSSLVEDRGAYVADFEQGE